MCMRRTANIARLNDAHTFVFPWKGGPPKNGGTQRARSLKCFTHLVGRKESILRSQIAMSKRGHGGRRPLRVHQAWCNNGCKHFELMDLIICFSQTVLLLLGKLFGKICVPKMLPYCTIISGGNCFDALPY